MGIAGAIYAELMKPSYEQSGSAIAFDITLGLIIATGTLISLRAACHNFNDDRE
jgi:hypothetical protein